MFKQRIFLISVVFIIHCFVRPFLISFRVRSSSVLSNAGIFRLTPFYASDEDIKSLYEKAQVEDAEWFQRVLGDNAVIIPEVVPGKVDEKSGVPVQAPTDKLSRAINRDEIKSLNSLGYSNDDITSMKKSIILVVLESNVKRPRKGLPESWLETPSTLNMDQGIRSIPDRKRRDDDSIRDGSGGGKRVIGVETSSQRRDAKLSEGRRGDRDGAYKEDDRRQQEFSRGNSGNRDPFDLEEDTRSERGSKVGEAFAWNGSPLTDEEVDDGQRVRRGVTNEAYQGSSSSSRSSSGRINKNDWDDVSHILLLLLSSQVDQKQSFFPTLT